jgi:hypothetical protein
MVYVALCSEDKNSSKYRGCPESKDHLVIKKINE